MELDPFFQGIMIAIGVGLPVGIITGILVKKYAKSKQEQIYEKNRQIIIKTMLHEIYVPFYQLRNIYAVFEKQKGFNSNKFSSFEFSNSEYEIILHYHKDVRERIQRFPKFHDCSTFVAFNEYLAIKKYLMSALFFHFVDASAIGKKNMLAYEPKVMVDHALFAKDIIEHFRIYLSTEFINIWTTILNNEGMLYSDYEKKPVEPGDLVQPYSFDVELLHS